MSAPAVWPGSLSLCLATQPPVMPGRVWSSWSFAPEVILPLLLVLAVYGQAIGCSRPRPDRGRLLAFGAGWLLLAAALTSPLCRAAATLAWAHMVQHTVLVAVAPPLLVCSLPADLAILTALRRHLSGGTAAVLVATAYAAVIWLAHAPAIYEAALRDVAAHLILVAVLLGTSLAFWLATLGPVPARSGAAAVTGAMLCFTAMVQTGLLGALLTFATQAWYPILAARAVVWGLDPLSDQQLAGLIMWVPMSLIYIGASLFLLWRWLESADSPMADGRSSGASLGAT